MCPSCLFSILPQLHDVSTDEEGTSNSSPPSQEAESNTTNNIDNHYDVFCKKGLHFLHLNARSLLPKLVEIKTLALQSNAAVIGISETWLDDSISDSEIEIPNYAVLRTDRNRGGGGVCMYIRKNLSFNHRQDLQNDQLEVVFADLLLPKSKPILTGICYRPPKQTNFYDVMEHCLLHSVNLEERDAILLGDFNTNMATDQSNNRLVRLLNNFCFVFNLTQLIHDYTRVTMEHRSIIDLILVSDESKISQHGVLNSSISDHNLIFCTRKVIRAPVNKHNTLKIRSMKNYSKQDFLVRLNRINWFSVLQSDDIEFAWSEFKTNFLNTLNSIAPFKETRLKQRTEPWIDDEILVSIRKRNKLFSELKKTRDAAKFSEFKKARALTRRLLENAKASFVTNKLEEEKSNPKKLWQTLKSLGSSSKPKSSSGNLCLNVDGTPVFDKLKVAEVFNNFFTTMASTVVSKIQAGSGYFSIPFVTQFYANKGVAPDSFSLTPVSEDYILKLLYCINCSKSTGLDHIPAKFLRDSADAIVSPLTHIINLSLHLGKFPNDLKHARVVPIHKKNNTGDPGNYRPISILSVVSKVLEKVVHNQLYPYLHDNRLLFQYQSGFRKSFSTESCLAFLSDHVRTELDKGNYSGMLLLDLEKAFDTVNHNILVGKLKAVGLNSSVVSWFSSYLSERKQLVSISGTESSLQTITCGVPQGSVLGPLLFLIYINDLETAVNCRLLMYSDDAALIVSGNNTGIIGKMLTTELKSVCDWMADNKLSLNLGKCESILFGQKRRLKTCCDLNILCNDSTKIKSKSTVKYLGAELDQALSGEMMAAKVISRANGRLKFLYRKAKFFDSSIRKLLASALVLCHYDYCSSFWYDSLTKHTKTKLQTSQNKLTRFVLNLKPRTHLTVDHFKQVGWLPVQNRIDQLKLCSIFRILTSLAPDYFKDFFQLTSSTRFYNTRSNHFSFDIPHHHSYGQHSFRVSGAKLWNKLPIMLRNTNSSLAKFKKTLKLHYFDKLQLQEDALFVVG